MELAEKILRHPKYIEYLALNKGEETHRKFCRHNLQHALDVARVAYIISLEKGYGLDKEIIYVTALLHDIAKWKQYRTKVDHASEGAALALEILEDIGIDGSHVPTILDAIRSHRTKGPRESLLSEVLYDSDKSCRLCINCKGIAGCNRFLNGEKPELMY